VTLADKIRSIEEDILSDYAGVESGKRTFNVNNKIVGSKEYVEWLKSQVPELAHEKVSSILAAVNRLVRNEFGLSRASPGEKRSPLASMKVMSYELTTPGGESFLVRTRDTETEITFLSTVRVGGEHE